MDENNMVKLYVYHSDMYEDLFSLITEYLGEAQHQGEDNISIPEEEAEALTFEEKRELRKKLLRKDFAENVYAMFNEV